MKPIMTSRAFHLLATFALFSSFTPLQAVVDLDSDGVGDVWRLKYNAAALAPAADADGDGKSNSDEAKAGTDPWSPTDIIKVTDLTLTAGNINVRWPSIIGKRYKVQSSTNLSAAVWTDATGFLDGSGSPITQSFPAGGGGTFYRVAVYEKDTDGDGVDDWEEIQLGLDSESSHTNGFSGQSDLAFVTAGLNAPSVVTVVAAAPSIAENALSPGVFSVVRSGGFKPLTVAYTTSGSALAGSDYTALTGSVVIPMSASSATISLVPQTDSIAESPESVVVTLNAHATYTLGEPHSAGILITDQVQFDGTGLVAQFWGEGTAVLSQTVTPTFTGSPAVTRIDPQVNVAWISGEEPDATLTTTAAFTDGYWSSRWTGEILPAYSQVYTFSFETNMAGRVWVNGQLVINNWPPVTVVKNSSTDPTCQGVISLEAGRRYPIIVEHYQDGGSGRAHLRWQSANELDPATSLVGMHVVPQNRLFPNMPPQITSGLEMLTFIGGPTFNYQITASATPTSYGASNLPPGLSINSGTGLISGSPTQTGIWQVVLTATNAAGSGSAVLELEILQAGGGVSREKWNVAGTTVASIPTGTTPASTTTLNVLQGPTNDGDSYGARIRGYISAPATGTYTFWLAADHAAQLFISDDTEPVNAWNRAELTAPSTAAPDWSTAAKSELLYLVAGRQYYFEVLHKEDAGDDFVAVGWAKPGQSTAAPSEVVPGYVLTQYTPAAPISGESTLYTTTMTAQGGAVTGGYGSGTVIMSADRTQAKLFFDYGNLTTGITGRHLHSGADGGLIVYDIDDFQPGPDGAFTWDIVPVAGITDKDGDNDSDAADIVKLIENGDCYINIHTANYPAGEIKGYFRLAAGSQTFTAPPAPPSFSNDSTDAAAASRFLTQATFGASPTDIASVQSLGYEGWIDAEFAKPVTLTYPYVYENRNRTDTEGPTYVSSLMYNSWWKSAVTANDQLRQKMTFALSQILVASIDEGSPLYDNAQAVSDYYDTLAVGFLDPAHANNMVHPVVSPVLRTLPGITGYGGSPVLQSGAFGNFRDIMLTVTLHPAMGRYLDMLRNDKPDKNTGRIPNENYAREIKQLFSLGLNRMHPDGSLMLDSKGLPVPVYDQDAIIGFSHAFTGWDYFYADTTGSGAPFRSSFGASTNWVEPMREVPVRHFTGPKRILNNVVLPGLATVGGQPLDPYAVHSAAQYADPAYKALASQELLITHDKIFNHPNVGPFICRQLIQRMVTSTPSPGYIYRVVQKFTDNGSGVRGDMKAVVKAILLDYEARSATARTAIGYGKQREPVVRITNIARAFPPQASLAGTWEQDGAAIVMNTTAPHRLTAGQSVRLTFGDANPALGTPLAATGTYSQSTSGSRYPLTANSFGVRARDAVRATYAQSGTTTVTVTVISGSTHPFSNGKSGHIRIRDGGLVGESGLKVLTVTSNTVFTFEALAAGTTTGECDVSYMTGSYSLSKPTAPATTGTCTITCGSEHGLATGANVFIDFKVDNSNFSPIDDTFAITVVDKYKFTVIATYPVDGNGVLVNGGTLSNQMIASADAPVLNRGGHVAGYQLIGGFGDFSVGSTDTALGMTPMASPTVFNFYLPDYQYPGTLAAAGLYTPEFQLTSDTTAMGQANYIYNGLFNPSYTSGISSFNNGGADIGVDISPWMDLRPTSTFPWTDNDTANTGGDNLRLFIREMSKLLMAGQMSTAMENEIYNFVTFRANPTTSPNTYTNISYTNGSTTTFANTSSSTTLTHRRDRARAVIHLITTSPEFTIQK